MIVRINHIALGVKDLSKMFGFFSSVLGLPLGQRGVLNGTSGVRSAEFVIGDVALMVEQPYDNQGVLGSQLAKFLESRGEGFNHIALEVDDLDGFTKSLQEKGIRLVSIHRPGQLYIHPHSSGGVLIQLVQQGYRVEDQP